MYATLTQPSASPERDDGRLDPDTVAAPARTATVRTDPLPVTGAHPPLWAVLGAHGGAGASTLARWWAPAADTGRSWPSHPDTTRRVVVAARDCMPGLTAAADRLREWHAGLTPPGIVVIGLVVVAARPGRVPAPVRRYRNTVADLVDGAMWSIAWHDDLVALELDDLAECAPRDPSPPKRVPLTRAVPVDVHRTGFLIAERIAATRNREH